MGYVAAGYLAVLGGTGAYALWLVRRSRQLASDRRALAGPPRSPREAR